MKYKKEKKAGSAAEQGQENSLPCSHSPLGRFSGTAMARSGAGVLNRLELFLLLA